MVDMKQPTRTHTEQRLYDAVAEAERQLAAARAKRDTYIRGKGKASHTITDLAAIFGMSREATYKIINKGAQS